MEDRKRLVPDDFVVPPHLETAHFRLRMLTIHDLIKDFVAVMASEEELKKTFSVMDTSRWPEGLTLEENLIDLGWHQREFTLRYSFAYTVMSLDESRCLGCVYIDPTRKEGHDAQVTLWTHSDELKHGLDDELYRIVQSWIREVWPFQKPAFPGREVSLEKWNAIPDTD